MNHRRPFAPLAATFLLWGLFSYSQTAPAAQRRSETTPQALRVACKATLSAIEKNRPGQLGALIAEQGIVLGVDAPATPKKLLIEDLQGKRGFFCMLFDSTCLQRKDAEDRRRANVPPRQEKLLSYREEIMTATSEYAICSLVADANGRASTMLIVLNKRTPKQKHLTLEFTLEKNQWKLSGLPEY